MKKSVLIIFSMSMLLFGDFIRTNGIVTDNSTLLQWQDDYSDNSNQVKYELLSSAIDYCENLTLNEYDDWRLPNIKELISLVDDTRYAPAINPIFKHTYSLGYISSTTHASDSFVVWRIDFNKGLQYTKSKAYFEGYVRCVR